MLTAVIRADDSPRALAATLSVLIPAVAEGFLGHAVIVDASGASGIESIADSTGASFLHASPAEAWRQGAGVARGEWLLLLDAGDVPQAHWAQAVQRHLLIAPERAALIPLRSAAGALRERAAISFGGRRLRAGLIVPKSDVLAGRLCRAPQRLPARRERAD